MVDRIVVSDKNARIAIQSLLAQLEELQRTAVATACAFYNVDETDYNLRIQPDGSIELIGSTEEVP